MIHKSKSRMIIRLVFVGAIQRAAEIADVELHRDISGAATACPGRYFPADILKMELEESFS